VGDLDCLLEDAGFDIRGLTVFRVCDRVGEWDI
jgi:hypothetical protein